MTNEKAVKYFKICKENIDQRIETKVKHSAFELAISALKKQIPKKVTDIHVDEYYCPNCGAENNKDDNCNYGDDYCPCCGQALDWGDTE